MNNPYAALAVNPFESDVVADPRSVTFSVPGLNEHPLQTLIDQFQRLANGKLPRLPVCAANAQLVLSPDAGYGKSHLLGRLFQSLGEQATQIYLRPFQNPEKAWHSILLTTVQELSRAEQQEKHGGTQLEAFAAHVLAHIGADFLASQQANDDGVKKAIAYIRDHPLRALGAKSPTRQIIDWLKKHLDDNLGRIVNLFSHRGIDLSGREQAWLRVLAGYAFTADGSPERTAALSWLRAEPLETDEARALKLRAADNDATADATAREINDLSLRRLTGICALSSYYRPFLFCFDQTEFYGSDKTLVVALGNCVEQLRAAVPNHLTVVTANAPNWTADIKPHLPPPTLARFSAPINLEGINEEQARSLLGTRLHELELSDAIVCDFLDPTWLSAQFSLQPNIGVRRLLGAAAERFRALANPVHTFRPKVPLAELLAAEVNKVRAKKALHQYNQDSLMWFAEVLAKGANGADVLRARHRYFSVLWDWPDRSVYFAFEGGDHHMRWAAIANEATSLASRAAGKVVSTVVLRTPDLNTIPRPRWTTARLPIEQAQRDGLRIVSLTLDEVCELHAARELYSNALQGNIEYPPQDVLDWLKQRFVPWFRKCSGVDAAPSRESQPPPKPAKPAKVRVAASNGYASADLTNDQSQRVATYVKSKRLVDIAEVLNELGQHTLRDAVLRAVEKHPNLKAHECPQTIYLQWRVA